jgi:hypothetical protein
MRTGPKSMFPNDWHQWRTQRADLDVHKVDKITLRT